MATFSVQSVLSVSRRCETMDAGVAAPDGEAARLASRQAALQWWWRLHLAARAAREGRRVILELSSSWWRSLVYVGELELVAAVLPSSCPSRPLGGMDEGSSTSSTLLRRRWRCLWASYPSRGAVVESYLHAKAPGENPSPDFRTRQRRRSASLPSWGRCRGA